jgi:hypothetical protein
MNHGAVLNRPSKKQNVAQPRLKDIFVPCPLCHGTLDMNTEGKVICCSCKAVWNVRGEPLSNSSSEDEE